jgi:hypothetical protein
MYNIGIFVTRRRRATTTLEWPVYQETSGRNRKQEELPEAMDFVLEDKKNAAGP